MASGDFRPAMAYAASDARHLHFVHIDVFASRPFEGNPLSVFTDAGGLSDSEMQDLSRETNLQEATFVLRRAPSVEQQEGVKVRIFNPQREIPFGGHPTLGTAIVLQSLGLAKANGPSTSTIVLDLHVGKVPVSFRQDADELFGEMQQIPPVFGPILDRRAISKALEVDPDKIEPELPIQVISTGLPFAIVPLKSLHILQSLQSEQPNLRRAYDYLKAQIDQAYGFYFVTTDTGDSTIGLRARAVYPMGKIRPLVQQQGARRRGWLNTVSRKQTKLC